MKAALRSLFDAAIVLSKGVAVAATLLGLCGTCDGQEVKPVTGNQARDLAAKLSEPIMKFNMVPRSEVFPRDPGPIEVTDQRLRDGFVRFINATSRPVYLAVIADGQVILLEPMPPQRAEDFDARGRNSMFGAIRIEGQADPKIYPLSANAAFRIVAAGDSYNLIRQ